MSIQDTQQDDKFTPTGREPTAREFLAVIFRRKALVLGLFGVTTLTVLVIALATPQIYMSDGRVLVRRGEQESSLGPYRQVLNDWEADLASEIEVAKSEAVLQRTQALLTAESGTHKAPKVDPARVDAQVIGKSTVVAIAYADRDPRVAQTVCNALLRAYIDYRQNTLSLTYPKGFFEGEISKVRHDLDDWMERRRAFADSNHLADAGEQVRSMLNVVGDLEQRRSELSADLAQAQSTLGMMKRLRDRPDIDLPSLYGSSGGVDAIVEIKRKVLDQEGRVALARERYRDDAPEVANALETLKTLREMLQREVDNRVEVSQARIASIQSGIDDLSREINRRHTQLSAMPDLQVKLAEMDREIEVLKTRYEELSKSGDQARVTENTTPRLNVVLLTPAGPAVSKTARDYVRLALAPAFSLVIGIGLAFFVDGLDLTVRTSGQAEEAIDLPVLATLNDRRRERPAGAPRTGGS
jgi:uncharacterized protein involved in exopolysaccharide biosynthesis